MHKITVLAVSISSVLLTSQANAANQVADARGNAMGNTGVASADYLSAPFYNPALGSSFRDNDDFALLLPAFGASIHDSDDSLSVIDDLQASIKNYESAITPSLQQADELNGYLDQLDGNQPLRVTAGLGFAASLPSQTVSSNLFARRYIEVVAAADVADDSNVEQRYQNSHIDMLAFDYTEIGLSFAKAFTLAGEKVSFGVTPKYQQLTTYAQRVTVSDFDIENYDESEISKNAFNFDLGAVWYKDNLRTGLALKNILAQEIDAKRNGLQDTYELKPQATLAIAYTAEYFTVAVDADLTKQTRFKSLNDDTQFVRFGFEGNAWDWAQLRAGYEMDLEDTLDNSITAGIGISPFDVVSLDIAGSYAGDNQFGASANLAFTF
ncbi:conjugal transfer protein TraF [Psychromonas sp.]|uniref:conjugal transfer protein TraF n=1 Tax=Psychromonas sp. TaxID=1884585 RepID=UPI003565061B